MYTKVSLLFAIIFTTSCNIMHCPTKEAFLDSYETFVLKVEQKRIDDQKDWTSEEKVFNDYAERCYNEFKADFTSEDKNRFWSSTLKYYYNRYNGNLNLAFENAEETLSEDFERDFKDMLENGDAEIIKIAKDLFKEDIKRGVDSVLDALNEIGDKIKESLEEDK